MTTSRFMDSWEYEYRLTDTDAEALEEYRDDMERLLYESGIDATPDSEDLNGQYTLSDLRDRHPDELLLGLMGGQYARGHYNTSDERLMVVREDMEGQLSAIDDVLEAEETKGVLATVHDRYGEVLDEHTGWYDRGHGQVDDTDDYGELFRESHSRQRIEMLVNPVNGLFGMVAGGMFGVAGLIGGDHGLAIGGGLTAEAGYTMAVAQERLEEGRRDRFQEETAAMMLDRIEERLDDPSIEVREY